MGILYGPGGDFTEVVAQNHGVTVKRCVLRVPLSNAESLLEATIDICKPEEISNYRCEICGKPVSNFFLDLI